VWRAEITVDEQLARELIGGQFELPLTSVELVSAGWDYTVFRVDEQWAFRFPRREVVLEAMQREVYALRRLARLLPFAVPEPELLGRPLGGFPWPFYGARWLPGEEAGAASDEERLLLAPQLGRALRTVHELDAPIELPVDVSARADMTVRVPRTREQLAGLWWTPPASVPELLARAERLAPPERVVICHGDLHFRQVLVDGPSLVGFVDWVDVCRADPGIDLQLAYAFLPLEGRTAFFAEYGEVADDSIVRARVMALSLGAILARYGRDQGLPEIEREALASLDRATSDL
jgi:aminoglycoside phosphotransferase (APT) family kinase protein